MQVALTVWKGRISPLFDTARLLLVAKVMDLCVTEKHFVLIDKVPPLSRVSKLRELGINVLICGGISNFLVNLIEAQGIQVIPFMIGTVDHALEAYLSSNHLGGLNDDIKHRRASKNSYPQGV